MSIPRILFFTLLVVLAITEIPSSPVGGKGSKPPESPIGERTGEENVRDINERRVSEDIHGNSAIDPQTVNRHVDAVPGDNGYIPSNIAGPSGSNPSHKYREDSPILSTNPLSDALSSVDLGSKPKTLTQLSEKGENTKSDGASERKPSEPASLFKKIDEMRKNFERHEAPLEKPTDPLDQKKMNLIKEATPAIVIPFKRILNTIPEVISWKKTWRSSEFTDFKVPEELRTDLRSFKKWFMETLPNQGYFKDKMESNEDRHLNSIYEAKTIIRLQDPITYGFVVPEVVIYVDDFHRAWIAEMPEWATVNYDRFHEWLKEEIPKHNEMYIVYNPHLSIKYEGSLQSKIEIRNNIEDLRNRVMMLNSVNDPQKIDPITGATPIYSLFNDIVIPNVISWKKTYDSEFMDIKVPEELKTNQKSYKEWFMKTLPDQGYYIDKGETIKYRILNSIEKKKTIIKLQDYETYGFLVPNEVIYHDPFNIAWSAKIPEKAIVSPEKFNEWFSQELPKHYDIYMIYNPSLSIHYRGYLKPIEMKQILY